MTAVGSDDVPCQKPMDHSCMVSGVTNTLPPSVVVGTCSGDLEEVDSEVVITDSESELSHDSSTTKGGVYKASWASSTMSFFYFHGVGITF